MRFSVKGIAYLAFLVALAVILTRLASVRIPLMGVEGIRLGLGAFPAVFAGLMLGPLAGGIVGALGDVIGFMLWPMGPYMPHFTLTAALSGVIPALVVRIRGGAENPSLGLLLVAIAVGQLLTAVLLVPYFLQSLFGIPFMAVAVPRLVGVLVEVPIYAWLSLVLLRRLAGFIQQARLAYTGQR